MTISRTYSRWENFYNVDAVKSVPFLTNGQCVQKVMEAGKAKARPSAGVANSEFLGVSFGIYKGRPPILSRPQKVTSGDASGGFATALLDKPIADINDVYVYKGADYSGTLMTKTSGTTAPTSATEYRLEADGRTLTFTAANAKNTFFVIGNFSPTEQDYRFAYENGGDVMPGNRGPEMLGQIVVITAGIVYTDQFDRSVNWGTLDASTPIKGGANGVFTTNGAGCICHGVKVREAPSADRPFLGLTLAHSI